MNTDMPQPTIIQTPPPQAEIAHMDPVIQSPPPPPGGHDHIVTKRWYLAVLFAVIFVLVAAVARFLTQGTNQANTHATINETQNHGPTITPHAYQAEMSVVAEKSTLKVGEQTVVAVVISANGKSLDGADAIITYDPQIIEASILKTTAFPQYPKRIVSAAKGKISLTGITLEPHPTVSSSDIRFAELSFKAKKSGKTPITIVFKRGDKSLSTVIENGTSNMILGSVINTEISVTQ